MKNEFLEKNSALDITSLRRRINQADNALANRFWANEHIDDLVQARAKFIDSFLAEICVLIPKVGIGPSWEKIGGTTTTMRACSLPLPGKKKGVDSCGASAAFPWWARLVVDAVG